MNRPRSFEGNLMWGKDQIDLYKNVDKIHRHRNTCGSKIHRHKRKDPLASTFKFKDSSASAFQKDRNVMICCTYHKNLSFTIVILYTTSKEGVRFPK